MNQLYNMVCGHSEPVLTPLINAHSCLGFFNCLSICFNANLMAKCAKPYLVCRRQHLIYSSNIPHLEMRAIELDRRMAPPVETTQDLEIPGHFNLKEQVTTKSRHASSEPLFTLKDLQKNSNLPNLENKNMDIIKKQEDAVFCCSEERKDIFN